MRMYFYLLFFKKVIFSSWRSVKDCFKTNREKSDINKTE